jgi:hypothetical protein
MPEVDTGVNQFPDLQLCQMPFSSLCAHTFSAQTTDSAE